MLEKFLKKGLETRCKTRCNTPDGEVLHRTLHRKVGKQGKKALCRDRQGAEESAMGSDYVREGW